MFYVIPRGASVPSAGNRSVYLRIDHWNDFSFITMFHISLHDEWGNFHEIGSTKIGFMGQTPAVATYDRLPSQFGGLDENFFSLGQTVDFYKGLARLSAEFKQEVLAGLADIVKNQNLIDRIEQERVFGTSLLRYVSISLVRGQFARVLSGQAERTDFNFRFSRTQSGRMGAVDLEFGVKALSTPSTNIHAVIGRNGVGKTKLLNGMVSAIVGDDSDCRFFERNGGSESGISGDYFSSLVSISFSAFDSFRPPQDQPDPARGTCYFYVGLKALEEGRHRSMLELQEDCTRYLISCFLTADKTERWFRAIDRLGSDENFASMGLSSLKEAYDRVRGASDIGLQADSVDFSHRYFHEVKKFLDRMSSGHAVVLLTTTCLVARVEEKTLILLDEPESHLHPPLLSAFIRALSDLLHDRNAVAIIATHSPVVLQEIPRSCVWKINRSGISMSKSRPDVETFGESVGLLTSEVFGLEVERSGFHALLAVDVSEGKSYDQIVGQYGGQLGLEGRSILRAMIAAHMRGSANASSE